MKMKGKEKNHQKFKKTHCLLENNFSLLNAAYTCIYGVLDVISHIEHRLKKRGKVIQISPRKRLNSHIK